MEKIEISSLYQVAQDFINIFKKEEKVDYIHLNFKDNKITISIPFTEEEIEKEKAIKMEEE